MEMCWAACSVQRGCITMWPFSEEDSWRAHGRNFVFYWAKWSPQKSHSTWAEAGSLEHFLGMQTLVWQEDFVGPGMPSNLERLQLCCRNPLCLHLGGTWDVFLGSSQCPWPAHLQAHQAGCRTSHPCIVTWIYQNEPEFKTSETTGKNPWPPVMAEPKNIALVLLHLGSWPATEITQSQTQSYHSVTCWFSISPGWVSIHTWSKIFWVGKKCHL